MRFYTCFFLLALFFLGCSQKSPSPTPPTVVLLDYVNPLMGTDSEHSLSNGNTYPAIARPWGMNFWTPMTHKMGDGWTYQYDAHTIRGFKQTHQPSPWINDYAAFSFMPVTGSLRYREDDRASWFSHKAERVKPHYYEVYLADYDTRVALTPTERAAYFQFSFPQTDTALVVLDAFKGGSMVKILPEKRQIIGYCRNNHGGVPDNFHNYFIVEFDHDFVAHHTWADEWVLLPEQTESEGDHVGAIVQFAAEEGVVVHAKVASSFISPAQAALNLEREIGTASFDSIRVQGQRIWEEALQRIVVESPHVDHLRTFYSCLYRLLLFPRAFHEVNAAGKTVHYSPYSGQVCQGYLYTDNGFWDTFRAVFPFFNLLYPTRTQEIMEGLGNTYRESGWLPEWASPGHRNCMIGSNSAPIIADAFLKGNIPDSTLARLLFEAVLKNATEEANRPVQSVGREGLSYYNRLGYVPYDVGVRENAARTLEYAYADFAIAQMAQQLGESQTAQQYYEQAKRYQQLYDPSTGWMRGKNADGQFQTPFNPLKWGDAFTEGNSLHYTWSVFHDVQGLINLMGGDSAFVSKLDAVFEMPPHFDDSYYGFTIHEIREMQIANMGNYAHGNQPIQHMLYLYNYAQAAPKTQARIRQVLTQLYHPTPDGYCGDEDNGQTSAWYVFSALGFYPVTPATDQYAIGSPLFDKATLTLEDGKKFVIVADNNALDHPYIQQVHLNGQWHDQPFITFQTIREGGEVIFDMSPQPNPEWGRTARPFSMSL